MEQFRYCINCVGRTEHELDHASGESYNPRGRGVYRCLKCGRKSSKRHLRPSAESSY